jgi:nucleotide-binding universal stress UspA family protein
MAFVNVLLVPTDFSEVADKALPLARAMAQENGAKIVLLHVVRGTDYVAGNGVFIVSPAEREAILRTAQAELDRRLHDLRQAGVAAETLLQEGLPDREIIAAAKDTRADMIVMGTHGRTGIGRLFLGSIAQGVVAYSPRPVLLVPPTSNAPAG